MSETNNSQMNIEEKRQRILNMIEKYWNEEDKKINREEILKDEDNVEKIYTYFSTKEKSERDKLLEQYQNDATQEYLTKRENLYKSVWETKKLIMEFEASRQTKYDKDEADELLNNIE